MNVLIAGSGQGSWQMRGVQLGAAMGARVTTAPTAADWAWADVAVLVKRAGWTFGPAAWASGIPVVWDALDFWRQPADNGLSETAARALLARAIEAIRPALVIGATQAMAAAAGGVYLPHHGRLGLAPTDARAVCRVVGYDGNVRYLDEWRPVLERLCADRGWALTLNPPDLAAVDLLVSLRGGPWDGWMCRAWKSGVKIVNAILAGRPIIAQSCAAFDELAPDGSLVESPHDLAAALGAMAPFNARVKAVETSRRCASAWSIEAIAADYLAHLSRVCQAGVPCSTT